MLWCEYTALAAKTALPQCYDPIYLTLGIIGELGEFEATLEHGVKDDIDKKGGDVLWYCAMLASVMGVKINEFILMLPNSVPLKVGELSSYASRLAEHRKKILRGDDRVRHEVATGTLIRLIIESVVDGLALCGLNAEVCAQKNLNKLRDRQQRGVLKGSGDNR